MVLVDYYYIFAGNYHNVLITMKKLSHNNRLEQLNIGLNISGCMCCCC